MAPERADLALPEHHEELRASRTDCTAACSDAGSAGPNSLPTSTGQAAEALHRGQHDAVAGAQHNAAAVPVRSAACSDSGHTHMVATQCGAPAHRIVQCCNAPTS